MRTYTFRFHDKTRIITELELSDIDFRLDLKRIQNSQNGGRPVIFCNCSTNGVPMKLSEHYPKPHFYNATERYGYIHFKYCPHRLIDENEKNYSPSVLIDDLGNKKFRLQKDRKHKLVVDYLGDDLRIRNDDYRYVYNNLEDQIQEGRMTFWHFVRYCNLEYFTINQYTKKADNIQDFNKALYGYAMAQKVNNTDINKFLGAEFYYKCLKEVKRGKRNTTLTNEDNKKWFVPNQIYDKAYEKFIEQYGEISLDENDSYKVVIFGCKAKKKIDDGRIITDILTINFAVVTKDGLMVDCMSQLPVFNYIYDKVKDSDFVLERPNEPRDYYIYYPNLVADCIIRHKKEGLKALVEVFEKHDAKHQKIEDVKLNFRRYKVIDFNPAKTDLEAVFRLVDKVLENKQSTASTEEKPLKKAENKTEEDDDFVFEL